VRPKKADTTPYTEADGDYFQYSFMGNGIQLLGATGPEQGDIDIYIDGKYKQTVSTYSTIRLSGQQIYEITGLTNGVHTIKAVKASGEIMTVDQLVYSFAFETLTPSDTDDTSDPTPETPNPDDSSDRNPKESDSDNPSNTKDTDTTLSSETKTSTTVQKQNKTGNSPKTGDETSLLLLGLGCFISILAVFLISRKQIVKSK